MLQKLLFLLLLTLFSQLATAQIVSDQDTLYGNEWIDYSQIYYKIKVSQDGFYRISYQELVEAGVFTHSTTPQGADFQVFLYGKEQPLYVSTAGTLSASDYIEFYGKRNRGWLDQFLYADTSFQLNPAYSMYTDTATYFLTWKPAATSKRFTTIQNDLSNLPSKENYCWYEATTVYHDFYSQGREVTAEGGSCRYDLGEGYGRNVFQTRQNATLNTPFAYKEGPDAEAKLRFYVEYGLHNLRISLEQQEYWSETSNGWAMYQPTLQIAAAQLKNQTTFLVEGLASDNDKIRLANLSIIYPRQFDFAGQSEAKFQLIGNGQRQYLEIQNFSTTGSAPILYDLTNQLRILTTIEGNVVKVVLPPASGKRELVLVNASAFRQIHSLSVRNFIHYDFLQASYDYIILTHPDLYQDDNGNNYIQQYADYRASAAGGNYSPLIVDVTQLYDQFGYGIYRHEVGIRNFLKLTSLRWHSRFLYIIGKGVDRHTMRDRTTRHRFDMVPPFGQPHSDYLFVMDNNSLVPWMAVGRIAAYQPEQVRIYLNKVKEFEAVFKDKDQTIEERAWMKKVLHFGGGDPQIQNLIQTELNRLKDTLESSHFGANVVSFFKNSTDVIQSAQTDEVKKQIDEGAALISFFGHSAPSTLDFNIGSPEEYNNKGKYPIFYAIGCNTNRVFDKASTLSEEYVFVENRGAIAFFGATWVTQLSNLSAYAKFFYGNLGKDNYGQTLGEIIRSTVEDFSIGSSTIAEQLKQVLMLHGDPALRVYPFEKPDYIVNVKKTALLPDVINLQVDSFKLNFTLTNIGKAVQDSMVVTIEQVLPNGSVQKLYQMKVATPFYEEAYTITLPVLKEKTAIGKNELRITVDAENEVEEAPAAAELNNTVSLPFFIITNDITPLYPRNFSIVSETPVRLLASTTNAFAEQLNYYIEIDTTEAFTSPLKQQRVLAQKGGVVEWKPEVDFQENVVYYWRVSIDSTLTDGKGFNWNIASFVYLPEKGDGWNQSHFYQLAKNDVEELVWLDRKTNYQSRKSEIRVVNGAFPPLNWGEVGIFVNGFRNYTFWPCPNTNNRTETILISVIDSLSGLVDLNPVGDPTNCWRSDLVTHIFYPHNIAERSKVIEFLQSIKSGKYVLFMITQDARRTYRADEWAADSIQLGTNLFQIFEEQGITDIRKLATQQTPYILFYQKDIPSYPPIERHAEALNEVIELSAFYTGRAENGSIYSTTIGPARSWQSLQWQVSEKETHDVVSIDVFGVTADEEEVLLQENIMAFDTTLAHISAEQYPYLRLRWNAQDTIHRTTPQLDYWRVLYESYPEVALAPNLHLQFHADTLQQGEPLKAAVAIANISNVDMDSLLVKYTVVEGNNNEIVRLQRLRPLTRQDTLISTLQLDTRTLVGTNKLIIEANPSGDQLEQFDFNNIGIREFVVETDKRNPVLDVTFDGVHILNGDLISPKPQIVITLEDENQFLALNDTALFQLRIRYPSGEVVRFSFNDDRLTFYPASENLASGSNKARIELRPEFFEDGLYQLTIAAEDQSGNDAGEQAYVVEFEVINKQMISNVFNYPNPFTTSTQFVFTLTGAEVPQDMLIQIMTVSGRIVREITMAELGPLKIGNNITDFRWDGTDEFGDKLANGVYLYRVITRNAEGKELEKYDTGTDSFFTSGIGKMVILR